MTARERAVTVVRDFTYNIKSPLTEDEVNKLRNMIEDALEIHQAQTLLDLNMIISEQTWKLSR